MLAEIRAHGGADSPGVLEAAITVQARLSYLRELAERKCAHTENPDHGHTQDR